MYKRIMNVVKNVVYWASLVGPIYSLVKGAIDGVVAGIQSIRADDKYVAQLDEMRSLPMDYVDLSCSQAACNFNALNKVIRNVGSEVE